MTTETINADIFIIPNHACDVTEATDRFINTYNATCDKFKLPMEYHVTHLDTLVQIWTINELSNSWADHMVFDKYFIGYLPLRLIKDLKEGDSIETIFEDGKTLVLTANQLGYRYRNKGRFEDVLALVTA